MRLEEVLGQDHLKKQIRNFAKNERIPHAMLLLENTRMGALKLALSLANIVLCKNQTEGKVCGECQSCSFVRKFTHPDLHFVFPVIKKDNKKREDTASDDFIAEWRSFLDENAAEANIDLWLNSINAENKQANINVKECVQIIKKLSLKSFLQGAKVMIVWLPEYLGKEANRLLKLVEEPPENTFIIFVSANEELIMGTLRSRCQVLRLSPIPPEKIASFLKDKYELTNDEANTIGISVESDMALAKELASSSINNIVEEILQWFRLCFMQKPDLLTNWIDQFNTQSKTYQVYFLKQSLSILRVFLQMEAGEVITNGVNQSDFEKLKGLSNVLDFNKIQSIALILSEGISFVPRNINMKIMMMADSLTIGEILRKKD